MKKLKQVIEYKGYLISKKQNEWHILSCDALNLWIVKGSL
jgi:hypothetical protein